MKKHLLLDEKELIERAVSVPMEKLGPVETSRFLALQPKKRVESVRRHRQWQRTVDKGAVFDEIFGKAEV